ncbi:guanine nucleotide binding protein, alpha subunit [Gautieria morchelliformis]|nr:guanine nucleotide binding protein, alpha subunit [Gautieria morchelliformis]
MDGYDDPLTLAIQPPPDETTEQRGERIKEEQEALRISEAIDKELHRERAEKKKHRPEIKVLLLGPSGSGKSTTLKNFQLIFTPKALQAEAAEYTALVYLNIITTVLLLCDVLHEQDIDLSELADVRERCSRLRPVLDLEESLASLFSDSNSQPPSPQSRAPTRRPSDRIRKTYEVTVNAVDMWKTMHSSVRKAVPDRDILRNRSSEHARRVLAEHRKDIEAIAHHPAMQALLAARSQKLEHLPGYFLKDLDRITAKDYMPTDDDILRTRIRTLGVSETHFKLETGPDKGQTWVVIDVGGSRNQRAAWVPYFDDVNAIIFLASIGDFDQFLKEDRTINCLKDTLELWESIVSNKLLGKAEIILFLNKYDMLSQKIGAGVVFSKFVTSYKDRNNAESVGRYLQRKFAALHKQRSSNPTRTIHSHFTSVTNKSSTAALIGYVRVTILRSHLGQTKLL